MRLKPYTTYTYLYDEYIKKGKTAKDIAENNGVTEMTVFNWLKKHDLLKYKGKGRVLGKRTVRGEF